MKERLDYHKSHYGENPCMFWSKTLCLQFQHQEAKEDHTSLKSPWAEQPDFVRVSKRQQQTNKTQYTALYINDLEI